MKTIQPIIGLRHILRDGTITKPIVSSVGVCDDPERYPFMEEGNMDKIAVWAMDGEWDDRGSEWPFDIVGIYTPV
jgi:hypothetical protein